MHVLHANWCEANKNKSSVLQSAHRHQLSVARNCKWPTALYKNMNTFKRTQFTKECLMLPKDCIDYKQLIYPFHMGNCILYSSRYCNYTSYQTGSKNCVSCSCRSYCTQPIQYASCICTLYETEPENLYA
jgi:hypothetical protein